MTRSIKYRLHHQKSSISHWYLEDESGADYRGNDDYWSINFDPNRDCELAEEILTLQRKTLESLESIQ